MVSRHLLRVGDRRGSNNQVPVRQAHGRIRLHKLPTLHRGPSQGSINFKTLHIRGSINFTFYHIRATRREI